MHKNKVKVQKKNLYLLLLILLFKKSHYYSSFERRDFIKKRLKEGK